MRSLRQIYNYYLSRDKALAKSLKPIIGFVPRRLGLFKRAFYHKSMNGDSLTSNSNNERLEFLGDAILSSIVAEYLFRKYPHRNEGFLTKMRSKIVKRQTLNSIADNMGLGLILKKYSQGRMSHAMLGNALEALVGAVYIEFGYEKTKSYVIKKILMQFLDIHQLEMVDDNFKSKLLEWSQKNGKQITYKIVSKFKMDKRDRFRVAVVINGKEVATAEDYNKKSAEQSASRKAIKQLKIGQMSSN